MRYLLLLVLAAAMVFVIGLWQRWHVWPWQALPRQYNPFAPLYIGDAPTPITRWKLKRLDKNPQACMATLSRARRAGEVDYRRVGSPAIGECQLDNAVRIRSSSVRFSNSFLASCPMAVSWLIFERHQLQPTSRELFDQSVARVEHLGSFACRNIYHRKHARRSEHATANAFDVSGFRLEDGTHITIGEDWDDPNRRGEWLHRLLKGACKSFGNVLGPDYNAAHHSHFHLGMRGFGMCH